MNKSKKQDLTPSEPRELINQIPVQMGEFDKSSSYVIKTG